MNMKAVTERQPAEELLHDEWEAGSSRFTLGAWTSILWVYRRTMLVSAAFLVLLGALLIALAVLILPSDRVGTTRFRLTFEGAANGKYPNGLPFNFNELVSAPVLAEVYQRNELSRYGKLQDFANSVFVLQSNPQVELLDREYQSKLSDGRLTPVDRARLEGDYQKKRESLLSPEYAISLRASSASKPMPPILMAKALDDVLSVWATQAVERKGALKYDIPVVSRQTVTIESLEREDYIIGADILRAQAQRLLNSIGRISALPGGNLVRSKSGLTLGELRANVDDELRFRVQPLFESIRLSGITKDPEQLDRYFSSQLRFAKLKRDEAVARGQAYAEPLRAYVAEERGAGAQSPVPGRGGDGATLMPQLSESFLGQLMALSRQAEDVKFRQELTQKMVLENLERTHLDREVDFYESLQRDTRRSGAQAAASTIQKMTSRAVESLNALNGAADQILDIYAELSARNLSPQVGLYAVTSPFRMQSAPALPLWRAALTFFLVVLMVLLVVPAACLVHFYRRGLTSGR